MDVVGNENAVGNDHQGNQWNLIVHSVQCDGSEDECQPFQVGVGAAGRWRTHGQRDGVACRHGKGRRRA